MTTKKQIKPLTVAEYITRAIDLSGKSQAELCDALGYPNRNVITMFKQGRTKLPVNRVRALAIALGVDPAVLLRLVMNEYSPEAWQVIEDTLGEKIVTKAQRDFDRLVKEEVESGEVNFDDPAFNAVMRQALKEYNKRRDV
jgi:transcriptional regulator with XRE-family HTH domain